MLAQPHICLQCQLRLARRLPTRTFRIQTVFNSTSADQGDSRRQSSKGHTEEKEIKRPYIRPDFLHQTNLSRRPLRTQYRLGKLHGLHGKKLREERERLDIDALGEPADVIVLRDSKFRTYSPAERIKEAEVPESIDILNALDSERGLPGQQEVDENINQFRPKEGRGPKDWDEFNTLVKDIQVGFTSSQLARYIRSFTQTHTDEASTTRDPLLLLHVSPWMPETTRETKQSEHGYTRGYSVASYTNKQKLVLRLLRECWKVEIPELEFGVGEVEIELKPKDYDLLLNGSPSVLSLIASEYITGNDERIDGFQSRRTIRITASRQKSEMVIGEIEAAVRNVRREHISLRDLTHPANQSMKFERWAETHFNTPSIKFLSDITNTKIDVLPKHELLISCIDPRPKSTTGNRIDIAMRLLITSANFSNSINNWLGYRDTSNKSSAIHVLYPSTEGLGWRDRLRQWTRWTAPIPKRCDTQTDSSGPKANLGTDENGSDLADDASALFKDSPSEINEWATEEESLQIQEDVPGFEDFMPEDSITLTDTTKPAQQERERPATWQYNPKFESSALVGSVLHSYADIADTGVVALQSPRKSAAQRAFSTAIPNLSRILSSKFAEGIEAKSHKTLTMHFQPNPFIKSQGSEAIGNTALSNFPAIEMRFSIDPDNNEFKIESIVAVRSVSNLDLMLPDSPSDIRFQHRSVSHLLPAQPSCEFPPSIAQFLRDSTLDIKHGNFSAPTKLSVPIAEHLIMERLSALQHEATKDHMLDVEYLFTGLEVRKTVVMEYDGWPMHYTSIEAGKAGGRRGELRLLPVLAGYSEEPIGSEEFVRAACRLAEGVDGPSITNEQKTMSFRGSMVWKPWVHYNPDALKTLDSFFSGE